MIERLKLEKLTLAAEMNNSRDQAIKATELKESAEEETNRLKFLIQAAERDKQILQQDVQNLTGAVEASRTTTVKSVNKFLHKLKLDLNLYTDRQHIG